MFHTAKLTLRKTMGRLEGCNNVPELELKPVGRQEIVDLLKKLGSSHVYGHVGMDSAFLSLVAESVANPIRHKVNLSMKNAEFAQRWKIGRIIPLHMGGLSPQIIHSHFSPYRCSPHYRK